jgi:uncharacterized protein involved in cysteine biosynthesis
MLDAAIMAVAQMFTRPLRLILLKASGLAIALLVVIGILLQRLLSWLTGAGGQWIEGTLGSTAHYPAVTLEWLLTIAVTLGIFAGAIFLMPAVTSLVASFFADDIAEHVERQHYPADPPGKALPVLLAAVEGIKVALLALLVYLCVLPFLFIGIGAVMFFLATAYLLGREYFELAAMRFHPADEAKAIRRANRGTLFVAGMFIAAFVSIPILNLATPLFGVAFMVHMHKRLAGGPKRELLEPAPRPTITR